MENHDKQGSDENGCNAVPAPSPEQTDDDGQTIMQWEVNFEITFGDTTTYRLSVRGPHGMEPNLEGEAGQQCTAYIQTAFERMAHGLRIAREQDPSVKALVPNIRLDFCVATVEVNHGIMIANPEFLHKHEPEVLGVIFLHEYRHLQHDHISRSRTFVQGLNEGEPSLLWKIAFNAGADLEINSELEPALKKAGLQDDGFVPGHGDWAGLPLGMKAEEYAICIMATPALRAIMEQWVADKT